VMLSVTSLGIVATAVSRIGWLPIQSEVLRELAGGTCSLASHLAWLLTLVVYARYTVLDAAGKLATPSSEPMEREQPRRSRFHWLPRRRKTSSLTENRNLPPSVSPSMERVDASSHAGATASCQPHEAPGESRRSASGVREDSRPVQPASRTGTSTEPTVTEIDEPRDTSEQEEDAATLGRLDGKRQRKEKKKQRRAA
jgi:hypothetical protein